jgi:hypothetical protein
MAYGDDGIVWSVVATRWVDPPVTWPVIPIHHPPYTLLHTPSSTDAALETEVRRHVRRLVAARMPAVVPFVRVTVLPGPPQP